MDPLSDVLEAVKLTGVIFLRAELGQRFGIAMPPPTFSHPVIKPQSKEHRLAMFHIVRQGEGYVEVEGFEPQPLAEGDLIIVLADLHHSVVDAPGRDTVASSELVALDGAGAAPPAVHVGPGERKMRLVCGMLQFVDRGFNPLFAALPPYLLVRRDDGPSATWLQENISHIIREAEADRPGSQTLLSRLTELLFVETLRCYLEKLPAEEKGWFAAFRDPVVGQAVTLIHQAPAHPWTVAELAKRVAVSRSAFSARFTELLDVAPMTYVTRWRLRLASNLLEDSKMSLAEIATRIGYESESAFSRAFRRETGESPAAWRSKRVAALA